MILQDIIRDHLNQAKNALIDNHKKKGLRASGKFERSLSVEVDEVQSSIKGVIKGARHSEFMEIGRRPNRDKSIKSVRVLGKILEQWVKDKGLEGKVNPYAAAYKIVHEGIKVPNAYNPGGVISDTINKDWIKDLNQKLRLRMVSEYRSHIYNFFKT